MSTGFEACPYCGKKIIKGAMKCMGCGKLLKTAEEQQRSIDRYKESQASSFAGKLFKFVLFVVVVAGAGVVYRFYGGQIIRFVSSLLKR